MNIEIFYSTLDNLFMEKKMDKAELFLKDTLSAAEAAEDFGLIIAACNELGGLYRVLSRYDEGMPLYEKALKRMQRYGYILERFISPEGYFPYIILSSDGT